MHFTSPYLGQITYKIYPKMQDFKRVLDFMVRYQNLTRKPELFRPPPPLGPGPGTMYPLNPPLAGPDRSL